MQVTREHMPQPPEMLNINVVGNPPTDEAIAKSLLSVSLSSPNIRYQYDIDPSQGKAVISPERSSNDHFKDTNGRLQLLEQEMMKDRAEIDRLKKKAKELAEKDEEWAKKDEEMQQWEVYSRIAQAINDEVIADWRSRNGCVALVQTLETYTISFLPWTLTAEAISWCEKNPKEILMPARINRLYTDKDRKRLLNVAKKNERHQRFIDWAWELLEASGTVDLELMLTAWGKRKRLRSNTVYITRTPDVGFAKKLLAADGGFDDEMRERAKELIENGLNSHGDCLFVD